LRFAGKVDRLYTNLYINFIFLIIKLNLNCGTPTIEIFNIFSLDIIDEALLLQDPISTNPTASSLLISILPLWSILDRYLKEIDSKKFIYDERVNRYPAILQTSSQGKSINLRMRKE
jgi:hypothetical protein